MHLKSWDYDNGDTDDHIGVYSETIGNLCPHWAATVRNPGKDYGKNDGRTYSYAKNKLYNHEDSPSDTDRTDVWFTTKCSWPMKLPNDKIFMTKNARVDLGPSGRLVVVEKTPWIPTDETQFIIGHFNRVAGNDAYRNALKETLT